jgi:hypothetical protein
VFFDAVTALLEDRSEQLSAMAALETRHVLDCNRQWWRVYRSKDLDQMQQAGAA